MDELEKSLQRHAEETAGVILEPLVQGAAGIITQPAELPIVGDIRQRGLMIGIEIVKDRASKEIFSAQENIVSRGDNSLHCHKGAFQKSVTLLFGKPLNKLFL